MSILSVDTIQPIGSGSTVTLNAAKIVVGTGITFESNGQAIYAGIITATSFSGSGANLTNINSTSATGDFSIADKIIHTGDTNTAIRFPAADTITAETGGTERLRINSDGKLLLGHTVATEVGVGGGGPYTMPLQVIGNSYDTSGIVVARYAADNAGPTMHFVKSRNATKGSQTVVQDGDTLGMLRWFGSDGTDTTNESARISGHADGAPASDRVSGMLRFHTTDTQNYSQERVRINKKGAIGLGGANYGSSGQVLTSQGSGSPVQWASVGTTVADQWRVSSTFTLGGNVATLSSNWERSDTPGYGQLGSGMTESSGVFTFPSTGIYLINFNLQVYSTSALRYFGLRVQTSINNMGAVSNATETFSNFDTSNGSGQYGNCYAQTLFDVTNTSTHKVRFAGMSITGSATDILGSSTANLTSVVFLRLGNT